jgi:hypothetical protein
MYWVGYHSPPVRMASNQLLSNFGKKGDTSYTISGVAQGLADIQADIVDTAHLSTYFHVVEFEPVFTAGKNSISFNGSDLLADGSEIKVEVLDSDGNSLYLASPPESSGFVDIANFTVAIHVYQETISGAGKVILVGTTPKGEIVRWVGNITINTTYPNASRVRFYHAPTMEVTPLLYPVVESITGSYLSNVQLITGSFYVDAFPTVGISQNQYILRSINGTNPNSPVPSFNSQMAGAILNLDYYTLFFIASASDPTLPRLYTFPEFVVIYDGKNARIYKHATASPMILNVKSTSEVEISPISLGLGSMEFPASFTSSYVNVSYIPQIANIPTFADQVNPGYMQLHTNTDVFSGLMVGQNIRVTYGTLYFYGVQGIGAVNTAIRTPPNPNPVLSGIYPIVSVIDPRTANIGSIHYKLFDTNYDAIATNMSGSIAILTASSPYQYYSTTAGSSSLMQKSYVDILYRNTDTFSGFIARHKLYAKSNIYPGDFNLIQDSVVGPTELLTDPITVNKAYARIGVMENQNKVDQYWLASSASLELVQADDPLSAGMSIIANTSDYSGADGNSYVIAKNSAIDLVNDSNYYPFDAAAFAQFNGAGYASNFIFLPQGVLHVLSANMVVDKDPLTTAKIEFYFTSSFPTISGERDYSPVYGWKLGTITVPDKVKRRRFPDVQKMFFTPLHDYYGTLVIVPYRCNVTMTNISMQNYGDYGFSPGAIEVQLPFPINVANESYTLKAELFDSNASLVYTIPIVIRAFDPAGASLFGTTIIGSSGTSTGIPSIVNTLTVQSELYLPGIGSCPSGKRLLGYNIPTHYPPLSGEGSLCYTGITDLELIASTPTSPSLDYLSLSTTSGTGRSLAIRYSGTSPNVYGRRVYVDPLGNKTTYL